MFAGDGEAGLLGKACNCAVRFSHSPFVPRAHTFLSVQRAARWMLLPVLTILVVLTIAACIHFERMPLGSTLNEEPLEKVTVGSNEKQ